VTKSHWHLLVAFVAGGFLFAPLWGGLRRVVGR
jgi:hypothetical protein